MSNKATIDIFILNIKERKESDKLNKNLDICTYRYFFFSSFSDNGEKAKLSVVC